MKVDLSEVQQKSDKEDANRHGSVRLDRISMFFGYLFSRVRNEGFLFPWWGSGGGGLFAGRFHVACL